MTTDGYFSKFEPGKYTWLELKLLGSALAPSDFDEQLRLVSTAEPLLGSSGVVVGPGELSFSAELPSIDARELAHYGDSFRRSCLWLLPMLSHRTAACGSKIGSSYGLKHKVEEQAKEWLAGTNPYVFNGCFIAAAISLGFSVRLLFAGSRNCSVGLGQRALNHHLSREARR